MSGRIICFIIVMVISGCGGSDDSSGAGQILFPGIGDYGIFDPSLTYDPDGERIWMSYSEVDSSTWLADRKINTRLAGSDNGGDRWRVSGLVINQAEDVTLPGDLEGTWEHEVSSICYDPYAPASERWKLLWHRYLSIGQSRLFEHGWIGMKAASAPEDLETASERKLFVGSSYDVVNNTTIGAPEVQLDQLDPELNSCLVFSEPAVFAADNALYVCMLGAEGSSENGKIVLVKYPYPGGPWEYCGTFLLNSTDGPALGYHGFSAPSVYEKNGTFYLMVTPQINDKYLGTLIFEITDLDNAVLRRTGGVPEILSSVFGAEGSHNGASGYVTEASGSGMIYSEVMLTEPLEFKIFASHVNP